MMEDWIIGVLLVLFLIIPPWLALSHRKELQKQVEALAKIVAAHWAGLYTCYNDPEVVGLISVSAKCSW